MKPKTNKAHHGCPLHLHPDLKEYLGYCFYKAATRIRSMVDLELAPFGVVAPQFGMLIILDSQGSMTQGELAEFMSMDKATMVRMIDGLQAKKFLTRVPSKQDRRSNRLAITPSGRSVLVKLDQARERAEGEFLAALSRKEQAQLRAIIGKLSSAPAY